MPGSNTPIVQAIGPAEAKARLSAVDDGQPAMSIDETFGFLQARVYAHVYMHVYMHAYAHAYATCLYTYLQTCLHAYGCLHTGDAILHTVPCRDGGYSCDAAGDQCPRPMPPPDAPARCLR